MSDRDTRVREAFSLFDMDNSGKIKADALGDALRAVGRTLTDADVASFVERAGQPEYGGVLTLEQFQKFESMAGGVEKTDKDIEEAFAVFDNGANKGAIDVDAFKAALTSMGDKLTDKQVLSFLHDAGFDGKSSEITVSAFTELIEKCK